MPAGILGGLALGAQQRRKQHVVHQRGLARAADAGDADQPSERNLDVDVLEIVLGGALEPQRCRRAAPRGARARHLDALAAKQIVGGERSAGALARSRSGSVEHDLAAVFAGSGSDIEHAIRGLHHLRIVLDHDQRVAGVAQALHDADDAVDVARMQADRRLIEHEQGVDQRSAERRGEIDPLHLAAGQGARLAVEIQISQARRRSNT